MNDISQEIVQLSEIIDQGDPSDARSRLQRLLQRISHDLKNPLSTFSMELFMIGRTITKLRASGLEAQGDEVNAALASLESIVGNLNAAAECASKVVSSIDTARQVCTSKDG